MKSRAERVDAALERIEGREDVLWTLVLGDRTLRRGYICDVTGLEAAIVVKTLAKLANDDIVTTVDGLSFALESKSIATELKPRVPDEDARRLHEAALAWLEDNPSPAPLFEIRHLLGADRAGEAAEKLIELVSSPRDPDAPAAFEAREAYAFLKRAHARLEESESGSPDLLREVAIQMVEIGAGIGIGGPKPRELIMLINRLREQDLAEEARAGLDAAERRIRAAAKPAPVAAPAEAGVSSEPTRESATETSP